MNSLYVYEVSIILLIDFTIDKEDLNWIYVDSTIEISMDSLQSVDVNATIATLL
jgi:hypothetical protein